MTMDIFKGIGDTLKCMSKTKKDGAGTSGLSSENGGGALIPQKLAGYKEPKKVSKIKKVKKGKREQDKYLSDLESGKTIAVKKPSSLKEDMNKIAKAFIVVRKSGMDEADKNLLGALGTTLISNKKKATKNALDKQGKNLVSCKKKK